MALKRKELQIEGEEDIVVMNTVTINSNLQKVTINLKAPIIINIKIKLGEQIILKLTKSWVLLSTPESLILYV